MRMIALVFGLALIASACGGAVVTSSASTPTERPTALPQASGADVDVCALITAAEAEVVMGQAVTSNLPFSEVDSDYGEMVSSCYYTGKDLTIVVSTVDFGSAQSASEKLQIKYGKELAGGEGVTISEEPGLGEKAYWTIIENAGIYTFLKGSRVFVVGIVGNTGDATVYKASLLSLAKSVASK